MKSPNPKDAPAGKFAFLLWMWKWASQSTVHFFLSAIRPALPGVTVHHLRMFYVGACALGLFLLNTPLLPTWAQLLGLMPLASGLAFLLLIYPFSE
ncbi:MAG: hypothetical protein KKG67_17135 [Gammaproteobacteria bacterium]|nr:hypothetical protein [Gammaproteobacteria bacterium]